MISQDNTSLKKPLMLVDAFVSTEVIIHCCKVTSYEYVGSLFVNSVLMFKYKQRWRSREGQHVVETTRDKCSSSNGGCA